MKRFTETLKWSDPWFRKLPPHLKCLWQYFCDACDPAGVIDIDWDLVGFQIGADVSTDDLEKMGDRVCFLGNGKLHIKDFVRFQYGELSEACPAHKPVFRAIKEHGLDRVSNTLQDTLSDRVSNTLQEKEEEKEKEKERVPRARPLLDSIKEEWNALPNLPKIQAITPNRETALKARTKERFFLENWQAGMKRVAESLFCQGENDNGWIATFEWFIKRDSLVKIMEGKYDNRPGRSGAAGRKKIASQGEYALTSQDQPTVHTYQ